MPPNVARPSPSSSASSSSSSNLRMRLLLLQLLLSSARLTAAAGSCRLRDAAARAGAVGSSCCPGRDNSCRGLEEDEEGRAQGTRAARCFCDAHCEKTGDCCQDHGHTCRHSALDCVVSPWGSWTPCDPPCTRGTQERARAVLAPPRNAGGTGCPELKQRRGCYSPHGNACRGADELASLLPDFYKQVQKDPWRRPHMVLMEEEPSHCVYFRVDHVSSACQHPRPVSNRAVTFLPERATLWANRLRPGGRVCAECRGGASRGGAQGACPGEGLQAVMTFWEASWAPGCRGSWIREERRERCDCRGESHAALLV